MSTHNVEGLCKENSREGRKTRGTGGSRGSKVVALYSSATGCHKTPFKRYRVALGAGASSVHCLGGFN